MENRTRQTLTLLQLSILVFSKNTFSQQLCTLVLAFTLKSVPAKCGTGIQEQTVTKETPFRPSSFLQCRTKLSYWRQHDKSYSASETTLEQVSGLPLEPWVLQWSCSSYWIYTPSFINNKKDTFRLLLTVWNIRIEVFSYLQDSVL